MLKMRWLLFVVGLVPFATFAQNPRIKNKKYQGLLWEITGKDLKKPSYLFGTMHVSSKLAFHLADSFYLGIRGADVVALETNPETWQADMVKYNRAMSRLQEVLPESPERVPDDQLTENTLKFFPYEKKIEASLQSNPSTINSLLYRSYGNEASDFEEDTYLDMYIFQCGKRWGKKVAGVEDYDESMRLMAEAYRDAARDKNRKPRVADRSSGFTNDRLQESYRTGNLDWLDSINYYNSTSAAFDEKFLFRRNEIQARSIDSIIRSGASLFVGVGAAHLPGDRGVIELLRAMGYQLRPVKMGTRDSEHKTQVEKLRVPVTFKTWQPADHFFKVDVPGELFAFGDQESAETRQYADMANGSYYIVTRIMTNAWLWNHNPGRVLHIVDSLLYENVPGKILSKEPVRRDGYEGYKIVNRTRRGDMQRYEIYVTPFEVLIFKMSGTGDYVTEGSEAERFFSSISFKPAASKANWIQFQPSHGGFSIDLPQQPYYGNDGSAIFDAIDAATGSQFRILKTVNSNHSMASEDSFDLGLMEESFSGSEFIEKRITRKQQVFKGYPSLDVEYRDKSGKWIGAKFLIQGQQYYTLVARAAKPNAATRRFFQSFSVLPYQYQESKPRHDTLLFYTVNSPVFPELEADLASMPIMSIRDELLGEKQDILGALYRSRRIAHDSTGENIFVSFIKNSPYEKDEDLEKVSLPRLTNYYMFGDSMWGIRRKLTAKALNGYQVNDWWLSDSGSSRVLRVRQWKRPDRSYTISTVQDTLTKPSRFINDFFHTFQPADSIFPLVRNEEKVPMFFKDFSGADSLARARAKKAMYEVELDSSHLPQIISLINSLDWKEKDYMSTRQGLYSCLSRIKTKEAADYLVKLYHAAGDTTDLQNSALSALAAQQTLYSYQQFRDIVSNEPPIVSTEGGRSSYGNFQFGISPPSSGSDWYGDVAYGGYDSNNFLDQLNDTLELTRQILPDLLPLLNLDEYSPPLMLLMTTMIDSSQLTAAEYQPYYSKFFLEARMEFRKAIARSRQYSMNKAREEQENEALAGAYIAYDRPDAGHLRSYMQLLVPFWDQKPAVRNLVDQIWRSGQSSMQYPVATLLLKTGKPVPDSVIRILAAEDQYRYNLYKVLERLQMTKRFPKEYSEPAQLIRGRLYQLRWNSKLDSVVYLDRLPLMFAKQKAYVYFFKYLEDKKEGQWKIGTVGLITDKGVELPSKSSWEVRGPVERLLFSSDWTDLSEQRFKDDEPVREQLQKHLRRLEVGIRPSGQQFYRNTSAYDNYFY